MIPTVVLERASTPAGEMVLSQRGEQFSIRVAGTELMNSANHGSEDELGRRTAELVVDVRSPRMLVGGLGLGYTLRAALDALPETGRIDIVEIVPEVVRWNRTVLGRLAGRPLDDPRVTMIEDDVAKVIGDAAPGTYHAIVLDVDNGPDELFERNGALYKQRGLARARAALAPGGVLAVWSAFDSQTFTRWMHEAGFGVEVARIKPKFRGGPRHFIWFGRKPLER